MDKQNQLFVSKIKDLIFKTTQNKSFEMFFYSFMAIFFLLIAKFIFGYGPFYSSDTIDYLRMASDVKNGFFPHSPAFSPGFPFIVGMTSKLLGITLVNTLILYVFVLISFSLLIFNKIIRLIGLTDEDISKPILISFLIISNWTIIKILISAHADALFFVAILIYFFLLLSWIKTFKLKWLIFASLLAGLCIWIKYNGMILIPFLIFASLIYGKKRFNYYYLIFPLFIWVFSYLLFKTINGTVIKHFQEGGLFDKILYAIKNFDLLFLNISLSAKVYFGVLFTSYIQGIVPSILSVPFFVILVLASFMYLFIYKRERRLADVFLMFSLFYWGVFLSLNQYIDYHEINIRTMFPAILSFLIWFLLVFKSFKNPMLSYFFIGVLFINFIYSFYYLGIINKNTDVKNTLNYISYFNKRKSIIELKKLQKEYDFEDRIFTNEVRNLSFALDFEKVRPYPARKVFLKGGFIELDENKFKNKIKKFRSEFKNKTSALLLIDCIEDDNINLHYSKKMVIGNDILFINESQ